MFVQYGPFVYGKSAKCVRAIWTIRLWKEREMCSCNMDHSFQERARNAFVQYGPHIYEKGTVPSRFDVPYIA